MRSPARVRLLPIPGPLPCAILLAALLAVTGSARPVRTLPVGATADDRSVDRIVGTVGGPVLVTPRGFGALVRTDRTAVWVWTRSAIEPGQLVAVDGRLRIPRGFLAPGSPDRAIVAGSRGAAWELSATEVTILADEPDGLAVAWRAAAALQRRLSARLSDSAALQGIVAGDRTHIPEQLDARWRAVGIYHVLSVSGLHLAVVAGLAFALLRRLVAASPLGGRTRPARWAAPAAVVLAIGYTLVTGAQLATLRALLVVMIVFGARVLDRPVRLVDALGAAAIVILAWRPQDLYDPSFQLSFVAALTLAVRPSTRDPLRHGSGRSRRVLHWLRTALATSAWVAVTTAPITALHFHHVAAGGVVGNLVLTPAVELLALPLGLAGALLGDAGTPVVAIAVGIVELVDDAARVLAHVMPVGTVGLGSPLLAATLVALGLWACSRRHRRSVELAGWLMLCGAWLAAPTAPTPGTLRVTFLDVGQGDAAIVELPDGGVWLVDAGGLASARDVVTAASPGMTIGRALDLYGHTRVDRAFLSHPHPDHYLGLAGLGVPITELWTAVEVSARADARAAPSPSFSRIATELVARGTRLVRPALGTHRDHGVTLHVLAPRYTPADDAPAILAPDPVRSVNDNSLVIAIEYGARTILFAGDLEAEGEEALVTAGLSPVDIVKVAHHGSPTSSSHAFVAATQPELAVISCGTANSFGFPAATVLARWRAAGAAIARTDLDGSITVTIGSDGDIAVHRYGARP